MHEKRIEIRWRDLDSYRHVNHAVFLTYLEETRDGWLTKIFDTRGFTFDYVVARVAIDFRRELTLRDAEVITRCRLDRIGRSSIHTREEIVTRDGRVAAEATVVLVVRDPKTGMARPLTEVEKAALLP